ncbi:MAG: leucine-rich repeat domain-containing protein [Candidatus Lokiarchaeota archaeon]|nr:leucine-rich repeat domain-containing protein [Candidatus Lokiarchaeota archaeon]
MEKFLSPETIYTGLKNKEISRNIAIDQLVSLIEGSNTPKIRSESISILNKLNIRDPKIFKIIENSLLSDESPIVRCSAVNLIGFHFLKEGLEILTWAVRHEKSPLVIKAIFDLNLELNDTRLKSLNKELTDYLVKIALAVGIVHNEAKFILDLEAIFAHTEENYELELGSYKYFTKFKDPKLEEFWLTIKNKHIVSLSFNYFNWRYIKKNPGIFDSISNLQDPVVYLNLLRKFHLTHIEEFLIPKSISLLRKLKKLNLSKNNIRFLPKSLFLLSKLKHLDLSYNMLSEIPKLITNLKILETLRIHNNQISEIPKVVNEYLDKLSYYKI